VYGYIDSISNDVLHTLIAAY